MSDVLHEPNIVYYCLIIPNKFWDTMRRLKMLRGTQTKMYVLNVHCDILHTLLSICVNNSNVTFETNNVQMTMNHILITNNKIVNI